MEWVRCEERLPEKQGRFCVRLTNGCIRTEYYTPDDGQDDPQVKWKHYIISAWLQLPDVFYRGCEGEDDWKVVHKEEDIASLPEGYYFVTVGDLVYVVDKCENGMWMQQSKVPYNKVDAWMPVPAYSESRDEVKSLIG